MNQQTETIISNDERTWATFAHLSALMGILLPVLTIIGPLAIWLLKKNKMPFVDEQGKEAVNFQLTMLIGFLICIPLMFIVVGFVLAGILVMLDIIFIIVAATKANQGVHYRYPFSMRIIK